MSKTTYESLDNKIAASTLTKDLTKGLDVVDGHGIKKPGEYENPDELYDMLIARIRKYHPSTDVSMIEKAYALAKEAHGSPENHILCIRSGLRSFWQIWRWIKRRLQQECYMMS